MVENNHIELIGCDFMYCILAYNKYCFMKIEIKYLDLHTYLIVLMYEVYVNFCGFPYAVSLIFGDIAFCMFSITIA